MWAKPIEGCVRKKYKMFLLLIFSQMNVFFYLKRVKSVPRLLL